MASWDSTWETIYRNRSWGKYPFEDLIRFIARNFYNVEDRRAIKILDLGCGTGASSWFIAREGFSVFGVDGSIAAIDITRKRFTSENLSGEFLQGDLASLQFQDNFFDAAIDIEALSCNSLDNTRQILKEVYRVLKPGGLFFSTTFRQGSWGDGKGQAVDRYTYKDITEGPCASIGTVRFIPEDEVYRLYSLFEDIQLEYIERSYLGRTKTMSSWLITCKKPGDASIDS